MHACMYGFPGQRSVDRDGGRKRPALNAGRPQRTHPQRLARVGRDGAVSLRLWQPQLGAGSARGGLHPRSAPSPVQGQGGPRLGVIDWVDETWRQKVGSLIEKGPNPLVALIALARGHAVYCRRDVARAAMALRASVQRLGASCWGGHLERVTESLHQTLYSSHQRGAQSGTIPADPPAGAVALALVGVLEGTVIQLVGQAPNDQELAARAAIGVHGMSCMPGAA